MNNTHEGSNYRGEPFDIAEEGIWWLPTHVSGPAVQVDDLPNHVNGSTRSTSPPAPNSSTHLDTRVQELEQAIDNLEGRLYALEAALEELRVEFAEERLWYRVDEIGGPVQQSIERDDEAGPQLNGTRTPMWDSSAWPPDLDMRVQELEETMGNLVRRLNELELTQEDLRDDVDMRLGRL